MPTLLCLCLRCASLMNRCWSLRCERVSVTVSVVVVVSSSI